MVKVIIALLLITTKVFAVSGQVVALDAPLFSEENTKSKIVQYARKGDDIYIHPAAAKKRKFTKHAPKNQTEEDVIEDTIDNYNNDYQDPMFSGDVYYFDPKSRFYQTLDNRGRRAYILRRHVRIIYEDGRELEYIKPDHDDTDYRLQEPLPKKYPLLHNLGHRGMLLGGLGFQNHTRIPKNNADLKINEPGIKMDLEMYWLKHITFDLLERIYFGALATFSNSDEQNKFYDDDLNSNVKVDEQFIRMSIGPIIYYDAWKSKKARLSTFLSFQFNFFQHKFIEVEDKIAKYKAEYSTISISPMTGLHYSVNDFYSEDYDFVGGLTARYNFPSTYEIAGKSTIGISEYSSSANIELSLNLGIKSDF